MSKITILYQGNQDKLLVDVNDDMMKQEQQANIQTAFQKWWSGESSVIVLDKRINLIVVKPEPELMTLDTNSCGRPEA